MVLSCDMDNPVILWRLKSESERKSLLQKHCSERFEEGRVDESMSFDEIMREYEECGYSLRNRLRN